MFVVVLQWPKGRATPVSISGWMERQNVTVYVEWVRVLVLVHVCSVVSDSLQPYGLQPVKLLCPWDFPGKNTGEGCHFLLQGIFLTQGLNLSLLHCRWILYH